MTAYMRRTSGEAVDAPPLRLNVLGPLTLEVGGEPVSLPSGMRRRLLGVLACQADRAVPVDRLVETLWEEPPASARENLRQYVFHLRRALGDPRRLPRDHRGYRLVLHEEELDAWRFESLVAAADPPLAAGDTRTAEELLRRALGLWRGDAYEGLAHLEPVRRSAVRLEEARLLATERVIEIGLARGEHERLVPQLAALVTRHPFRERLRGQYMLALYRAGRQAEALETYRQCRNLLAADLGLTPGSELRRLEQAILARDPSLDAPVRDAVALGPAVPAELPADVTVFTGRAAEVELLCGLLTREDRDTVPIAAISGPGGVGKSALATHVGHRVAAHYPDGQIHLDLHGASPDRNPLDAATALSRLLRSLGVPGDRVPAHVEEAAARFRSLTRGRRLLIVLDNARDAAQVRPLLPASPTCGLLITCRRRLLGIDGVHPVPLAALGMRESLDLLRGVLGESRMDAEPQAAAELAAHCGGLPLALRIVAARLRHRPELKLADLVRQLSRGRLDGLAADDVAVRTCLMVSHRQLDGAQRRLFRRIGLLGSAEFPGWVAAALLDEDAAVADRLLGDLVEAHLLEPSGRGRTGPRYRMHDLIHLLAGELAAQEAARTREAALDRVLDGWLDLAATADDALPHWYGLDPEPAPRYRAPAEARRAAAADPMAWFDDEAYLLGVAVRQAARHGLARVAWPLAQRLSTYLDLRGRYEEWGVALRAGLGAARAAGDAPGVACMLGLLVDVEAAQDRIDTAMVYAEQALRAYRELPPGHRYAPPEPPPAPARRHPVVAELEGELARARERGDPLDTGWAAYRLALARRAEGLHGGYEALFEEAADAFLACGAHLSALWALKNSGLARLKRGRLEEAARCLGRGYRAAGNLRHGTSTYTAGDIALVYAAQGRFAEAEGLAREALERARAQGNLWSAGKALDTLGELRRARGDHEGALAARRDALAAWRRLGVPDRIEHTLCALRALTAQGSGERP